MNVLLITADQWRGDALGCLGSKAARTPRLDALARDGVLLRNHHGQATPCGPARASLHTGLYAFNHRSITNGTPLDRRHKTLAELARAGGWDPVLFGYTDTSVDPRTVPADDPRLRTYEGVAPGYRLLQALPESMDAWLDHLASRGYGRRESVWAWYDGPLGEPAPWRPEDSETAFLTDRFLDWLAGQRGAPWFAHLSFIKPHPPFVAAAPFHDQVSASAIPTPVEARSTHPWLAAKREERLGQSWGCLAGRRVADLDPATVMALRRVYFALIHEVDHHIGRILDRLVAQDALDDTLVIVTADHGELLGDHGLLGKSLFHRPAFHVPLIVRGPGLARGLVVDRFTEHVDLMPTILAALGLPVPLQCDGHSLLPVLRGEPLRSWRIATHWEHDFRDLEDPWLAQRLGLEPDACSIAVRLERRFAYVHFTALPPLCFDTIADPHWQSDLAADPDKAGTVRDLAGGMLSWRMRYAERRLTGCKLTPAGLIGRHDPA
jgi:arylsulfatase A-like enzyme